MNLQKFDHNLAMNNIEFSSQLIQEVVEQGNQEAIPILMKYLMDTDSPILRNKIALALSDLGCEEAVLPIIQLLNSPKTLRSRGTLLYALKPLDYSNHIEILVDQMIDGNFEVRHESKELIIEVKDKLNDEVLQIILYKIKNKLSNLEEQMDFLTDSLEEFSKK